jgi:soluble lytic murein transglycosylase-like protein
MKNEHKFILAISILVGMLAFAWVTLWQRQAEIRRLEVELADARADVAELRGDIEDMALEGQYFKDYSFQIVMGTLIKKARQYRVPIDVALALCQIESAWNPFAISSTGDYGFYQLNEKAQKFDKRKIFEPEYNIDLGLRYLQKCYNDAGSWSMAVALYNAGSHYKISNHPRKLQESIFITGR